MEILKQSVALADKVKTVSGKVLERHIKRDDIVAAFWLALVSGRPAFFYGGFGIDKTDAVEDICRLIDGAVFYNVLVPNLGSASDLLVESTEIEESVDGEGRKRIRVREQIGRAANAHVLFLDEKYKALSPGILHAAIDLTRGGTIRHEGQEVKTPLLVSLAASNELPSSDDNLGANWSRETIRVPVKSLDEAGKRQFVAARLARGRGQQTPSVSMTLAEVEMLRAGRPLVAVPDAIVDTVLEIYQQLVNDGSADFRWLWDDDRRFGRVFDVLQANALLAGRATVTTQDLRVLKWLLWDTPEQISIVEAVLAPYVRTPASEAQELIDALLSPGGAVMAAVNGDAGKSVSALSQCKSAVDELTRLREEAEADEDKAAIAALLSEATALRVEVANVTAGIEKPRGAR